MSGRDPNAGQWIPKTPRNSLLVLAMALAVFSAAATLRYQMMSDVQTAYLGQYVKLSVRQVAYDAVGKARQPAESVLLTKLEGVYEHGPLFFLRWPALAGGLTLVGLLFWSIPADTKLLRERRQGRVVIGPRLVEPAEFTRTVQGDGFAFSQVKPSRFGSLVEAPAVVLPRRCKPHKLIVGATGSGKTVLIDELLDQIARDGDTAVVYDPSGNGHFLKKHFVAERGDVHLNPLSIDAPFWHPGDEYQREGESMAMATALFPHQPHESNPFFTNSARAIFAHLLEYRPTVHTLVGWMSNREHIVKLITSGNIEVEPATLADIMAEDAPAQKSGVMAALNLGAASLRLCPDNDVYGRWSATQWAPPGRRSSRFRRSGWI